MTQSQSQLLSPYHVTPESNLATVLAVCETGAKKKRVCQQFDYTAEEVAIMRRQYELHVPAKAIAQQWGLEGEHAHEIIHRLFKKHDPNYETLQERRRKASFTAEEAAMMRRQYELKVSMKDIAAQWGFEGIKAYDAIFRILRKHDPNFETFAARKAKAPRWCPWCGDSMPPFYRPKAKYCDGAQCKAERAAQTKVWCACGNKKGGGNIECKDCSRKRIKARVGKWRSAVRYHAIAGYTTKQIAAMTGLSVSRVLYYKNKLKLPPSNLKTWRPEQIAHWKAKVVENGSVEGVWQRSGISRSAFYKRLQRSGFIASTKAMDRESIEAFAG